MLQLRIVNNNVLPHFGIHVLFKICSFKSKSLIAEEDMNVNNNEGEHIKQAP